MSTGGSGLLRDTTLQNLDAAWHDREQESAALASAGHHAMALALRLYSLEIRIKAVICRRLNLDNLPGHCKTHNLTELIYFTGLWAELDDPANAAIRQNWDLLASFSFNQLNNLRYMPASSLDPVDLAQLLSALDDPGDGVLAWLSKHP